MDKLKVNIVTDLGDWEDFLASTRALVETSDRPAEAVSAFVQSLFDLFDEGGAIDFDHSTALEAGKLVVGLKPSQRFIDLVAAFRAGD